MKRIIYLSGTALALILATACDDFLSKIPEAKLDAETFFSDEKSLELYANGFVESMTPSAETLYRGDVTTDLIATRNSSTFLTTEWTSSSQTGWSYGNWHDLFDVNYFLQHMHEAEGVSDASFRHWEGVGRFWRAWFYYDKVRTFGAVPWYDTPIDAEDEAQLYKARDSREYVMCKVLEDLDYAAANCSSDSKWLTTAMIHKWIALAFKARVCLFEGTYRKYHSVDPSTGRPWTSDESETYLNACVAACEELMNEGPYSLVSNPADVETQYRLLFTSDELNRQEVIWGRECATAATYNSATWEFNNQNSQCWSGTQNLVYMYLNLDGSRFTDDPDYAEKDFITECTDRDYRMKQSLVTPGYMRTNETGETVLTPPDMSRTLTGYKIIKWILDDYKYEVGALGYNDLPILRYAEVLLNYAEAKAELNGGVLSGEVWDRTIRPLRERAGVSGDQPATVDSWLASYYTTTKSRDLLEIRRERAVELLLEDLRYDDLMRWHEGELVAAPWEGIYIPALDEPIDLDGDGEADLCVTQTTAGSLANVYYIVLADGAYTLSNGTSGRLQYDVDRNWSEKMYLRPIPRTATSVNPALGQNYGWDN